MLKPTIKTITIFDWTAIQQAVVELLSKREGRAIDLRNYANAPSGQRRQNFLVWWTDNVYEVRNDTTDDINLNDVLSDAEDEDEWVLIIIRAMMEVIAPEYHNGVSIRYSW